MAKFEILEWKSLIDRALRGFSRIDEIVADAGPGADLEPIDTVDPNHPDADILKALLEIQHRSHQLTFDKALATYRRHMLVYAVTLLESMIRDFAEQLFIVHPQRMISFIGQADSKTQGKIPLKQILNSSTKLELISELAKEAASRVSSNLKENRFSHLESVGKCCLANDLKDEIIGIIDLRNRIVHELSEEDVPTDRVVDTYESTLRKLSVELENMATENSIPTDREELLKALDELNKKHDV